MCGAWFAPSPTHTHIAHKSPLSLPPSPYWLQCQSPAGPIGCSACAEIRAPHSTAQPSTATTKATTNQLLLQAETKQGVCYMLHSNRRQAVRTPKQQRNKKDTTYMQILLLLLLLLPFSASSCPAGTWHFRLRLCPHASSLLLTHTAHSKNTGAGENEPTTRHVPSYDVRTRLTWLAGGGPRPPRRPRRADFIHGGGGSIRPMRHGISSGQRKAPPPSQGARCDEPTKGTNHRAAGLSSSA